MTVAPAQPRRPRQNGVVRPRPALVPAGGDAARAMPPSAAAAASARVSQAVASERPLIGRATNGPRTGFFLLTTLGLLLVAELILAIIPILRVAAWGIGLLTALGAAGAGVAAAHGARGRSRSVWLLTGAASGLIMLGMLARGEAGSEPAAGAAGAPLFCRARRRE